MKCIYSQKRYNIEKKYFFCLIVPFFLYICNVLL